MNSPQVRYWHVIDSEGHVHVAPRTAKTRIAVLKWAMKARIAVMVIVAPQQGWHMDWGDEVGLVVEVVVSPPQNRVGEASALEATGQDTKVEPESTG